MLGALVACNLSVAVWVGFLVLFGVVDDDGVVDFHLPGSHCSIGRSLQIQSRDPRCCCCEAGVKRIRPCLMTLSTTVFGLMPIFWSHGAGL